MCHRVNTVANTLKHSSSVYVCIYPVTMVSVGYHCGLSVIYPQSEVAVRHLGINHYILLTVTNEQSLQLFTYFTYVASCSPRDINILVDTTLKCGITNAYYVYNIGHCIRYSPWTSTRI